MGKVPCLEQRMVRRERLSAELTKSVFAAMLGAGEGGAPYATKVPFTVMPNTPAWRGVLYLRWYTRAVALAVGRDKLCASTRFFFLQVREERGSLSHLLNVPDPFAHK